MREVEPMSTFVGQCAAPVSIAGANAAHIIVLQYDAIGIAPQSEG